MSLLRRVPRAAWSCALLAGVSAACWSVITPPFQAPDEPSHFAYTQLLAQTGRLPASSRATFSPEEEAALRDLNHTEIRWHPEVPTLFSQTARRRLQEDLARPLGRVGAGAGVATAEPPLYYALEVIPYELGSGGTLLDRLELMRLLSSLMAALTALFTFLFLRELLPAVPWAWTVGGLAAAAAPLLGFTSGVVTPDAMLCAVSAAVFYCLARAFRRGLSMKLALAAGAVTAVGFLTKLNFIGLVPGVMLGFVVLGVRGEPGSRRAFGPMAVAMAIAVGPICLYGMRNLLQHRPTLGIVSGTLPLVGARESIVDEAAYVWQFYLPRLPGMLNYFPGVSTTRDLWFDRAIGMYGWLDTSFPPWVYNLALLPAGAIAILGLRSLFAHRAALRARLPELLVYVAMATGLMVLVGGTSDLNRFTGALYTQPRYLMPLLPLAAAALALAARGAGRRWGPPAGALIVVLFLTQDIFSQLLVVSRFYV